MAGRCCLVSPAAPGTGGGSVNTLGGRIQPVGRRLRTPGLLGGNKFMWYIDCFSVSFTFHGTSKDGLIGDYIIIITFLHISHCFFNRSNACFFFQHLLCASPQRSSKLYIAQADLATGGYQVYRSQVIPVCSLQGEQATWHE